MSDSGAKWLVEETLPEMLESLARTLRWLGEEETYWVRLNDAAEVLRSSESKRATSPKDGAC